jgi:MSHA biogenesis protein MshO
MQLIHLRKQHTGFTLIEMIAVIVILSVIAVLGTSYVVTFTRGTVLVKEQSHLVVESQLALGRIEKELYKALPYSFRISNGDRCVSFLPVVATGFYRNELSDVSNGLAPIGRSTPISVAPYQVLSGQSLFLSVGAQNSNELYGNNPASLASVRQTNTLNITLNNNHRWQRNSERDRFYITDNANAFCLIDNELRYYRDFSPRSNQVDLSSSYDLLALNIQSDGTPFSYTNNNCESCLNIALTFLAGEFQLPTVTTIGPYYEP